MQETGWKCAQCSQFNIGTSVCTECGRKQGNIMFCSNCGTRLPDDANFCLKCGKAQHVGIQSPDEAKWETCMIELSDPHDIRHYKIWVDVVGANGKQVIMKREYKARFFEHSADTSNRLGVIIKEIVNALVEDGWESTGKRAYWWQYTFKRPIS